VAAVDDDADQDPPIAGRPAEFNGAVGSFAAVATSVDRKELPAQSPLDLTVTITASGPILRPPQRPNLKKWTQFAVEDLTNGPESTRGGPVWQFRYRLTPLSVDVTEVPALEFIYYKPGIRPASKGYQTLYADAIPLVVKPAVSVDASAVQGGGKPVQPPQGVLEIETGSTVLQSPGQPWFPPTLVVLCMFLAPVLGCIGWYVVWRRLHPDVVWRRRRQQSKAARQAVRALQDTTPRRPDESVRRTTDILTLYLRERWELPALHPTPSEIRRFLDTTMVGGEGAERAATFLEMCDRARFAPAQPIDPVKSAGLAINLILTLEAESCALQ
jgi:hypothetical protein